MDDARLRYLFERYFNKTISAEEREQLMKVFSDGQNDEKIAALLEETWQKFAGQKKVFDEPAGEKMLSEILSGGRSENAPPVIKMGRPRFSWVLKVAAAVIALAIVSVLLVVHNKSSKTLALQTDSQIPKKALIHPGGNKAYLTLSDGSRIILDSVNHGATLATQGNAKVIQVGTGALAYKTKSGNGGKVVYNTLSTPKGGQFELILFDGTKVWLNSSSSIRYPTYFSGGERKVAITGEAYFEVASDPHRPFNVEANGMKVRVLGTHFNIMAYNDESSINTTLLEGSVKVCQGSSERILQPGQQSRVSDSGGIRVSEVDVEQAVAWKNGWFQFDSDDIQTVMRQLSRWYNVEVVYDGPVPKGHFSGIVSRKDDISHVLKIMEAAGVRLRIEDRKIIILS